MPHAPHVPVTTSGRAVSASQLSDDSEDDMPLSQVYGVQAGLVGGSREQPAKPLRASQPKPPAEEARGAEPSSPPASSRDRVAKRPRASQQKPPSEEARAAETRSPPASSSDGAAKRPRDSQHKPPSDEAPKPPAGNGESATHQPGSLTTRWS